MGRSSLSRSGAPAMTMDFCVVLQAAGAALLLWALARLCRWLWLYLWLPRRLAGERLAGRFGPASWALITGAGDGLGKAFARELARCGFNLILVSRTQSRLDRLKDEMQALG
ncbi:MAG: SDR family NAD(P)-dependent oxidoreductase, partial [Burkholderiales bacterium]|nr:SDR family NAD(P)-dependent oxidoreductase [Burkholderiales bacterium]